MNLIEESITSIKQNALETRINLSKWQHTFKQPCISKQSEAFNLEAKLVEFDKKVSYLENELNFFNEQKNQLKTLKRPDYVKYLNELHTFNERINLFFNEINSIKAQICNFEREICFLWKFPQENIERNAEFFGGEEIFHDVPEKKHLENDKKAKKNVMPNNENRYTHNSSTYAPLQSQHLNDSLVI